MNNQGLILVIEDDADDWILIQRALSRAGVSGPVRVIPDGERAIAYLAGEGEFADRAAHPLPSIMLLDLRLPRKNGLEVLNFARGNPATRDLPITVLTNSEDKTDVMKAYDHGASTYMVKPVTAEQVTEMLRSLRKT